jgi:hypothetical protein
MKKELTMTTAMAAALLAIPACSSSDGWDQQTYADRDTVVCVNQAGERVDDDLCDRRGYGYGGFSHYYFRRGAPLPYYGDSVHDRRFAGAGSFGAEPGTRYAQAPVGTRMTRSAAISRGGLGSSGRFFGGVRA